VVTVSPSVLALLLSSFGLLECCRHGCPLFVRCRS
jgi:hypothetical protein